jgi:hypothetical protein
MDKSKPTDEKEKKISAFRRRFTLSPSTVYATTSFKELQDKGYWRKVEEYQERLKNLKFSRNILLKNENKTKEEEMECAVLADEIQVVEEKLNGLNTQRQIGGALFALYLAGCDGFLIKNAYKHGRVTMLGEKTSKCKEVYLLFCDKTYRGLYVFDNVHTKLNEAEYGNNLKPLHMISLNGSILRINGSREFSISVRIPVNKNIYGDEIYWANPSKRSMKTLSFLTDTKEEADVFLFFIHFLAPNRYRSTPTLRLGSTVFKRIFSPEMLLRSFYELCRTLK